jgi:hypothetical protein
MPSFLHSFGIDFEIVMPDTFLAGEGLDEKK